SRTPVDLPETVMSLGRKRRNLNCLLERRDCLRIILPLRIKNAEFQVSTAKLGIKFNSSFQLSLHDRKLFAKRFLFAKRNRVVIMCRGILRMKAHEARKSFGPAGRLDFLSLLQLAQK